MRSTGRARPGRRFSWGSPGGFQEAISCPVLAASRPGRSPTHAVIHGDSDESAKGPSREARSEAREPRYRIDFFRAGKLIGIEITAPSLVRSLNRLLRELGLPPLRRGDLAPLRAA